MPKTGESGERRHKRMLEAQSKDGWHPFVSGDMQKFVDRSRARLGDKYETSADRTSQLVGAAITGNPDYGKSDEKTKADIRGRPRK